MRLMDTDTERFLDADGDRQAELRRQAMGLTVQLPPNRADAVAILECMEELLAYMHGRGGRLSS